MCVYMHACHMSVRAHMAYDTHASVRACVRVNVSTCCVQAARGIMDALTRVAISQALEQRVFENDSGDTNDGMTAHHNARAVCAIADTWRPCRWAQTPA